MSKFNLVYSLTALAVSSGVVYLTLMILEFSGRGFDTFTGLMAIAGILVYYPLLRYVYRDLQLTTVGWLLVMYGIPLSLFYYGIWTIVVTRLPDIGMVLILLSIGWIQYSVRRQLDQRVKKIDD